jgi:hypothetical protein
LRIISLNATSITAVFFKFIEKVLTHFFTEFSRKIAFTERDALFEELDGPAVIALDVRSRKLSTIGQSSGG